MARELRNHVVTFLMRMDAVFTAAERHPGLNGRELPPVFFGGSGYGDAFALAWW